MNWTHILLAFAAGVFVARFRQIARFVIRAWQKLIGQYHRR